MKQREVKQFSSRGDANAYAISLVRAGERAVVIRKVRDEQGNLKYAVRVAA
jgi:hypothetical protein